MRLYSPITNNVQNIYRPLEDIDGLQFSNDMNSILEAFIGNNLESHPRMVVFSSIEFINPIRTVYPDDNIWHDSVHALSVHGVYGYINDNTLNQKDLAILNFDSNKLNFISRSVTLLIPSNIVCKYKHPTEINKALEFVEDQVKMPIEEFTDGYFKIITE